MELTGKTVRYFGSQSKVACSSSICVSNKEKLHMHIIRKYEITDLDSVLSALTSTIGVRRRMDTRIRRAITKSVSLLFVLACVCSCSDKKIEERLKSLSGNEYLALSQEEKSDIVKKSLDRYTTWKFWERPDLCDYVLNENSLTLLYQKAAENAKENLMVYSFVVYANEECIKQGQFSK